MNKYYALLPINTVECLVKYSINKGDTSFAAKVIKEKFNKGTSLTEKLKDIFVYFNCKAFQVKDIAEETHWFEGGLICYESRLSLAIFRSRFFNYDMGVPMYIAEVLANDNDEIPVDKVCSDNLPSCLIVHKLLSGIITNIYKENFNDYCGRRRELSKYDLSSKDEGIQEYINEHCQNFDAMLLKYAIATKSKGIFDNLIEQGIKLLGPRNDQYYYLSLCVYSGFVYGVKRILKSSFLQFENDNVLHMIFRCADLDAIREMRKLYFSRNNEDIPAKYATGLKATLRYYRTEDYAKC